MTKWCYDPDHQVIEKRKGRVSEDEAKKIRFPNEDVERFDFGFQAKIENAFRQNLPDTLRMRQKSERLIKPKPIPSAKQMFQNNVKKLQLKLSLKDKDKIMKNGFIIGVGSNDKQKQNYLSSFANEEINKEELNEVTVDRDDNIQGQVESTNNESTNEDFDKIIIQTQTEKSTKLESIFIEGRELLEDENEFTFEETAPEDTTTLRSLDFENGVCARRLCRS